MATDLQLGPGSCTSKSFEDGTKSHSYRLHTLADTVVHGRVEQLGVDVETRLKHPSFERHIDTNSNRGGDETFWLWIPRDGELQITIQLLSREPAGYYQLHLETITDPTPQQLLAVEADRLAATKKPYHYPAEIAIRLEAGMVGDTLRTLGRMTDHLMNQHQYAKGLALLQDHQHLFTEKHAPWNHLLLMKIALFQQRLQYLEDAEQTYRRAYDQATEQSTEYAGRIANNIGRMLFDSGKTFSALNWYETAKQHYGNCYCQYLLAKTRINSAEAHGFMGRTEQARLELETAHNSLQQNRESEDLPLTLTELGWIDYLDGNHQAALIHFKEAEQLNRDQGNTYQLGGTLDRMGSALRELGRLAEAKARHAEAVALFTQIEARDDVAESKANLARDYFEAGDIDEAAALCTEILPHFRKRRPTRMSTILALAARIAHQQGNTDKADALYQEALEVVEQLYQESQSRRLRRDLSATRYQFLAEYSLFLWDQNEVGRAFQVLDGTRARILHQRLLQNVDPKTKGLVPYQPGQPLGFAKRQWLDLEQVRQDLDDDTLVLSYALHEDRSLVFALHNQGVSAYPLPGSEQLIRLAQSVYRAAKRSHKVSSKASWRHYSKKLSDMILKPFADQLQDKKRLIIIPDGALNYVPFAALPSPIHNEPMIWHHELSGLPSLSFGMTLRSLTQKQPPPKKTLLLYTDPILNSDDPRLANPITSSDPKRLPRLENCHQDGIISLLGSDQVQVKPGEAATRASFLETNWSDFRYLHVDTHGKLHPQPEFSALILSRFNHAGQPLRGELQTLDLLNLRLNLELVTLSACSTAAGEDLSGEGMWGLTAAFLEAGSQRVIASLWDVRAKPTTELFRSFYYYLCKEGLTPNGALRAAQRDLSQHPQWGAPFYWSAWVLQGEWQ